LKQKEKQKDLGDEKKKQLRMKNGLSSPDKKEETFEENRSLEFQDLLECM
jgi:hypothetical protein